MNKKRIVALLPMLCFITLMQASDNQEEEFLRDEQENLSISRSQATGSTETYSRTGLSRSGSLVQLYVRETYNKNLEKTSTVQSSERIPAAEWARTKARMRAAQNRPQQNDEQEGPS